MLSKSEQNKAIVRWFSFDVARVMQELGLVPPPQAHP